MKYNKFVFLYTSNFCARVNDFFCIDEWIAHGYDVEYWDLSAFTCHEHLAEFEVDGLTVKKIQSIKEFSILVKEYKLYSTLYLTWVNYCWYSAGFYMVLSKYNCDYAFFDNSLIPSLTSSQIKQPLTIKKIFKALRNRYYKYVAKPSFILPAKYYFQLSETFVGVDKMGKRTIHGWCNSGDYERNKNLEMVKEGKYIVFLDQYIPFHNDNLLNGYKLVDPKKYYSSLNNCFSLIEKKYGIPVVIAAHPAANKYKEENPFEGRELIYNKTAELVKGSEIVLAHFTTAISYVVLNKKKMLLLTSNAIRDARPQINEYIVFLSNLLGLKCINQDDVSMEEVDVDGCNEDKYCNYKYRYLTNQYSENTSNFDNIIKTIAD